MSAQRRATGAALLVLVVLCIQYALPASFAGYRPFFGEPLLSESKVTRQVHKSPFFQNSRREISETLKQLKGSVVASDLSVILRMVDLAQYQLGMESTDSYYLDGHMLRLASKFRRLRDTSEDTIRNMRETSRNFKKLLQLVQLRMHRMRADKAWQNMLKTMATDLEPVAYEVRDCADQVEHVIVEAKVLARKVRAEGSWCHECTSNSTELFNALDRIALLSSGLGSLVAEFYDYLNEGVQMCNQEAANRMRDDFKASWEQWEATGLDNSLRRMMSEGKAGEMMLLSYEDALKPFQKLEERCDEYLKISTMDASSRIPRRRSRAFRYWMIRTLPAKLWDIIPSFPENKAPRIVGRRLIIRGQTAVETTTVEKVVGKLRSFVQGLFSSSRRPKMIKEVKTESELETA
eukprot:CAMPEP_0197640072 /NCGR_PEP_ID=MMETSP1338-20131121/14487_1 /TAXON_ID=43686 ORGANISM="Pelagodinium beii, Strain RCC1491" /NCGR_SAMPLE_ID=MMETSP1338 /ASSEMBLY_ACC=CAM_ASM_000754 /LENGTH=405 /DNA_ID=CAMNT_0043212881 /DNA_START=28 /DNA_END=1245 /DNA_ORIENTATION=-